MDKLRGLTAVGWRASGRFIDIGCGTGLITRRISRTCDLVIGLDISLNMIRRGRKNKKVEYVIGDALNPPFRSGSFSQGICLTSFHHFPCKELTLLRMAEILVRGGGLVVSVRRNLDEEASEAALVSCPSLKISGRLTVGKETFFLLENV